jgi:serine/threonine protein kinase
MAHVKRGVSQQKQRKVAFLQVAVKQFHSPLSAFDKDELNKLAEEINQLARCKHENITKLLGVGLNAGKPCILMEFANEKSLYNLLHCMFFVNRYHNKQGKGGLTC